MIFFIKHIYHGLSHLLYYRPLRALLDISKRLYYRLSPQCPDGKSINTSYIPAPERSCRGFAGPFYPPFSPDSLSLFSDLLSHIYQLAKSFEYPSKGNFSYAKINYPFLLFFWFCFFLFSRHSTPPLLALRYCKMQIAN